MELTQANYHSLEANKAYMSNSQFKQFRRCEAMAMAEIKGEYVRPKSTAMLVGSYVDAYFSGELDAFTDDHPEILSSRGPTKGELKAEFRQAETIIERLEDDDYFMSFVCGECQQIFTGTIADVPFRGKLDFLHEDKIVDLKIVRDLEDIWSADDGRRVSWIRYWGNDIQAAIYRELTAWNTGSYLPFYLAVGTRETVMDKAIIQIAENVMQTRLAEVEAFAPRYQAIKMGLLEPERCEKCDYCKSTKKLTETVLYEGE